MCGVLGSDDGWDWDGVAFRGRIVRLSRDRRCAVCHGRLPIGHMAAIEAQAVDGRAASTYLHLQCRNLCHEIEGCYAYDGVLDMVQSCRPGFAGAHMTLVNCAHGEAWTPS